MGSFYDPAARLKSRIGLLFLSLLASLLDVGLVVTFDDRIHGWRAFVACIAITTWSNVASRSLTSCVFAPLTTNDSGTPIPSTNRLRLRPFFFRIRWVGRPG